MRKPKRVLSFALAGVLTATMCMSTVFATTTTYGADGQKTVNPDPSDTIVEEVLPEIFPIKVQYPSVPAEGGTIEKTFLLDSKEEFLDLNRADLTYQGYTYHYLDVVMEANEKHESKNLTVTDKGECATSKPEELLEVLAPKKEVTTEDGFKGALDIDPSSVVIKPTAYKYGSSSKTVTKTYTGLSDADLSYIPKTVTANGVTCSFASVKWTEETKYNPYDPDVGPRFTATVTYRGSYGTKSATNWEYEVKYFGSVAKDTIESYNCTLIYAPDLTVEEEGQWFDVLVGEKALLPVQVIAVAVLLALLVGSGFAIYTLVSNRKVETETVTEEILLDKDGKEVRPRKRAASRSESGKPSSTKPTGGTGGAAPNQGSTPARRP